MLIGLCFISAYGQYKYTLNFSANNLSGKKVYLNIFNNESFTPVKIDSFIIKKGQNIINGPIKQPSNFAAFVVSYKGQNVVTNFVLDSGKNEVTLDTPLTKFKSLTLQSNAKGHVIYNDLNNLFEEMVSSSKQPARVNGYLKIPEDLTHKIKQAQLKRLQDYPDDFGSLLYLYRLTRMDALPESAVNNLNALAAFSENLKGSPLGKQLYVEQTSLINNKIAAGAGKEVPLFKVNDINNSLFANSSLKGQPYMIVFSATWCGPCQKQLPKLKKLYQTYYKDGLKVIYFNDDNDVVRWKEHVSKNNLTWINVSERLKPSVSKIPKSFGVYSIPTCLVVNKKGVIIYNSDETDPSIEKLEKFIKLAVNKSGDDSRN